jgi:hypothetical protein
MTGLSNVVVGQLGTGEQLLLWALRQRRADRGETSPVLVKGFLLACGLAGVENALGRFEQLFDALDGKARCGLCPLRCAVLSADEARCLSLLACAQAGQTGGSRRLAVDLVGAARAPALCDAARALAEALSRAGHRLGAPEAHKPALH